MQTPHNPFVFPARGERVQAVPVKKSLINQRFKYRLTLGQVKNELSIADTIRFDLLITLE